MNSRTLFSIDDLLQYADKNPISATAKALARMKITNFKMRSDDSKCGKYIQFVQIKGKYNSDKLNYNYSLFYWKSQVPNFWKKHLVELNMWPDEIM